MSTSPAPQSVAPRLTVAETVAAARRSAATIYRALEASELHGTQRTPRGRWSVRPECLDAWLDAQPCEHQATAVSNVVDLDSRRSA